MAGCLLLYYMSFVAYFRLRVCKLLIYFLTLSLELPFALFLEDSLLFSSGKFTCLTIYVDLEVVY